MFIAGGNPSLIQNVRLATIWPGLSTMGFNNGLRGTVDGFSILRAYLRAHYGFNQATAERIFPRRQLDLANVNPTGLYGANMVYMTGLVGTM
jgi:hypothetical protein